MALDTTTLRSRRALLTAAAGGAAAMAASAAAPFVVSAAPTPMLTETANTSVALTSLTQSAAGAVAFKARTTNTDAAALLGSTGDETNIATDTSWTGVYGWSPANPSPDFFGTGLWGDSDDVGTYGSGTIGVMGDGAIGVVGRADTGGIGVRALNFDQTHVALEVIGKAKFSRSGRRSLGTGKSSLKITMPGVTSQSLVFAVLGSNRANRYVRAVVATTGSFTIYLNASLQSPSWVLYFVVN